MIEREMLLAEIDEFCERTGIGIARLGELAGMSRGTISRYRNDRVVPTPEAAARLRAAMAAPGIEASPTAKPIKPDVRLMLPSSGQGQVAIDSIIMGERLRSISEAKVDALMASMAKVGLINPVTLTRPAEHGPRLVAGRHRLEAARRLGWEMIAYALTDAKTEDELQLIEIDENLIRNELSPAERAQHVKARQECYERIHGKAKAIGANAANAAMGRYANANLADAFAADTASRSGRSERAVQRDAHRAKSIPQLADAIGTALDKGEELDALAKLAPEQQGPLIARAKAGEQVSARSEKAKPSKIQQILKWLPDLSADEVGEVRRAAGLILQRAGLPLREEDGA